MKLINIYLNENILKNEKDLYFHYEDWKINTDKNILFITGLSGSGKSYLSNKIKNEKSAILISLDKVTCFLKGLQDKYHVEFDQDLIDILNEFEKKYITKNTTFLEAFNYFFDFIFEYCGKHKDKLFIVEGIQIINQNMADFISENEIPTIVKGTSATKSFIQQIKRIIQYKSFEKGRGNNPFRKDELLNLFRDTLRK